MQIGIGRKAARPKRKKNMEAAARVKERFQTQLVYYDFNLLAVVILLTCFGLIMLYSTSAYISEVRYGDDMFFFGKQALISAASIVAAIFISRFDYHILAPLSGFIYLAGSVCMVLVQTPLGVTVNGARRWLKIGPVQFQPAEIAKIAIITFIPYMVIKMGRQVKTLKACMILLVIGGIQAGLAYLFTDNLSTGIIIGGITFLIIFVSHPKTWPFAATMGAIVSFAAAFVAILATNMETSGNFRIRRILVWLHPEEYSGSGGYQIMQALYAIGSGGFWGKGLGNGVQKLGSVPEAQNDMIFSIVCEELGVFGGAIVLLLFAYLLYRLLFIAQNAPDLYGSLVVAGIFIHIALQVVLNICVVLNLIPTTGITLPFVSYGGTSILFLMAEVGIALGVSRKINFQEKEAGNRG